MENRAVIQVILEPSLVTAARERMPSLQFHNNMRRGASTYLVLPGASRAMGWYEGPHVTEALLASNNVVAVSYPHHERAQVGTSDIDPRGKEEYEEGYVRAGEAIELLNSMSDPDSPLKIVGKSMGGIAALRYLSAHPQIAERCELTILGLAIDGIREGDIGTKLRGLRVVQGERDNHGGNADYVRQYLEKFRDVICCEPEVISVPGDHSYRGVNQDKRDFSRLPEHLDEVLAILRERI